MTRLRVLVLAAAVFALVLATAGCSEVPLEGVSGGSSTSGSGSSGADSGGAVATPKPSSPDQASEMLEKLTVSPAGSMAGYSREEFPHWASDGTEFGWEEPDGSCDVRDDALIRDGRSVEIDEDCSFVSGEWVGPYSGAVLTDSSDVDVDHIVPLANAWRSGADEWTESDRETYANAPGVLLATDDGTNQSKGDKGPEAWRPPNRDYWCEYAGRWVEVKSVWSLTVTGAERDALEEMLGTCGGP